MCITLSFHRVSARPGKRDAIRLGVFVSLSRGRAGYKSVSETCVRHALIPEHPVIDREASGHRWVQALSDAMLGGLGQGLLGFVR